MADNAPQTPGAGITMGNLTNVQNAAIGTNAQVNVTNVMQQAAAPRFLHQLPQPPADFTGREDLISQLLNDFTSPKGRNISMLTGMGGTGKTVLGLVIAHKMAANYPDAQIFLDLKGTTTPLSAVDIMRHVILSFEPGADLRALNEGGMADAYRSVLYGKRVLLFLDNARSAEQIELLRPPEPCAVIVTTRWVFKVPKLSSHGVDVLSEEDAEAFLLGLCPRVQGCADDLVKACSCLPLALRIAGSFLEVNDHWAVRQYLDRLKDHTKRFSTLEESRAQVDLSQDHPSLRASFELSYGQLSKEDKQRWRMLGVFPTSFDLRAVQAIWELGEDETQKLLGLLRSYSLLDYDAISSRYSLHDLLAEYACLQMVVEEEHQVRLKHAAYYENILATADDLYLEGGDKILLGLRLVDQEWENICSGQAWAAAKQGNDPALAELCLQYAYAGVDVLDLRQHPVEKIRWLEAAISSAREIGNRRGEGVALGNLGNAYAALGETRKAIKFYEQALLIDREMGDRQGEGSDLGSLGSAYHALGETYKAIKFYEQALVIDREIGDRRGEGNALGNLGLAYVDLGDARKGIEFYEQALVIDRKIGDRQGEGANLGNLGNAYSDLGKARKAMKYHEQTLVIDREIGDRRSEGAALGNLGNDYRALGDARKAVEYHEQALVIDREIGDRRSEGAVLGSLGNDYLDLGNPRKAIEYYEQALVIDRGIGDRRGESTDLGNMGLAYSDLGKARKAIKYYKAHLKIARETGEREGEGNALFNMGLALYDLGEKDRAAGLVKEALAIYEAIESPQTESARGTLKNWDISINT
jgi:tetratricopeptide (TPR) repeat protein